LQGEAAMLYGLEFNRPKWLKKIDPLGYQLKLKPLSFSKGEAFLRLKLDMMIINTR